VHAGPEPVDGQAANRTVGGGEVSPAKDEVPGPASSISGVPWKPGWVVASMVTGLVMVGSGEAGAMV
jgi:hypothetical protein